MFFFFQAEDGIRDLYVTGVQTCALPISRPCATPAGRIRARSGPRAWPLPRRRRRRCTRLSWSPACAPAAPVLTRPEPRPATATTATRSKGSGVADGALIVQSDRSILLEVDHPRAEAARAAIAPFAEIEKSPEHVHTYRLTALALWNARAAGIEPE